TAALASRIGAVNLLFVSMGLLELAVLTVVRFPLPEGGGSAAVRKADADRDVIGGSMWAGFSRVVRSPYLLGICAFLILYVVGSTFLYFAQADIVGRTYADRAARTAVLARVELFAQSL